MKFGEMDPMHVPANPSGIPQPNPYEQEGPDDVDGGGGRRAPCGDDRTDEGATAPEFVTTAAVNTEPDQCVVCGEPAQQHSAWCRRCAAALEEDRLNRETYG